MIEVLQKNVGFSVEASYSTHNAYGEPIPLMQYIDCY